MLVWFLLKHEAAVDKQVLQSHVASLACDGVSFLHSVEAAVAHVDVIDVCVLFKSNYLHTIFRLLAGDILHEHLSHSRVVSAAADFLRFVVEVDFQHTFPTLSYRDIPDIDVLNDTSTTGVSLDAEHAVEIW